MVELNRRAFLASLLAPMLARLAQPAPIERKVLAPVFSPTFRPEWNGTVRRSALTTIYSDVITLKHNGKDFIYRMSNCSFATASMDVEISESHWVVGSGIPKGTILIEAVKRCCEPVPPVPRPV